MNDELKEAILACDQDAIVAQVAALSSKERKAIHKHLTDTALPYYSHEERTADRELATKRWCWFHVVGLFGATKRNLSSYVATFSHETPNPWFEKIEDGLVQLTRTLNWDLAQAFADACVPAKDPHAWTIAYRLVKEGLAAVPDSVGWLTWLPDGIYTCSRRAGSDHVMHQYLVQEDEPLISFCEQFFRSPVAGRVATTYQHFSGIDAFGAEPGSLQSDEDWNQWTSGCIGLSMVALQRTGTRTAEQIRDLFFIAMSQVENTASGKWLANLLDWVCDDDQLLKREGNPAGRPTVATILANENASAAKWAMGRLTPLVKAGRLPLANFAEIVLPRISTLAKGTVKSTLKLMATRLKKEPDAAGQVAAAAARTMIVEDAKVQSAAITILQSLTDGKLKTVLADIEDADSVIAPSVRKEYVALTARLGDEVADNVLDEADQAQMPDTESEPLPEWPQSFDRNRRFDIPQDIDDILRTATQELTSPNDFSAIIGVVDALAKHNGNLPDDIEQRLGSLNTKLALTPFGYTLDSLRKDGWSDLIRKTYDRGYGEKLQDLGPVGDASYSEEAERENLKQVWRDHRAWELIPDLPDQAGSAWGRILGDFLRCWLGAPIDEVRYWFNEDEVAKERKFFDQARERNNKAPDIPFFTPNLTPPFIRWAREILALLETKQPVTIVSTPSHQPYWIAPDVLLERILQCESTDQHVPDIDMCFALLRLAREGRSEILESAQKLQSDAGKALAFAVGGERPAGIDNELLRCAEWTNSTPVFDFNYCIHPPDEYPMRGGSHYYYESEGGIEVEVQPEFSGDLALLPEYLQSYHRTRLFKWYDRQSGTRDTEPLMLQWFVSVSPHSMGLSLGMLSSLYTALGWSDSRYARSMENVLFRCFLGDHGPIPDAGYFCIAYGLGAKRTSAREHAVDALINGLGYQEFSGTRVGQHLGQLLEANHFTMNNPVKELTKVAAERGIVAAGLSLTLEAALCSIKTPPRGLNKLLDLLTEIRHDQTLPMGQALQDWLGEQPSKGALGKAVKNLLATV